MKKNGSQNRETLKESKTVFISFLPDNEALILNCFGEFELYTMNNHYSGYVLEIAGVGYEFCRKLNPIIAHGMLVERGVGLYEG